jgi:hypothetical protein
LKSFNQLEGKDREIAIQKDYWDIVDSKTSEIFKDIELIGDYISENASGDRVFEAEYAADLPANKFGSGFPTKEQDSKFGSHKWNFLNLNDAENSMLSFCKDKDISGINIPWVYMGMLYASFCWHYEDIAMYSINYMHEGRGKMWYAIPGDKRTKFEQVAKNKFRKLSKDDPNFLYNINSMICPDYLSKNGVTVYSTLQKPGEFILTFPESYHAGFSFGFNVAEAVNFTCPSWLKHAEKVMKIYFKSREKVPVFPLQWLILESNLKIPAQITKIVKEELFYRNFIRQEFEKALGKTASYEEYIETGKDDEVKYECNYCIYL